MRYSGKLGVAEQTEVAPGVWEETITEYEVLGTIRTRSEAVNVDGSVLPQYRTTMTVSVLSRGFGLSNNSNIRYLTHDGIRWTITTVSSKYPELLLYMGEEYHGPTPV